MIPTLEDIDKKIDSLPEELRKIFLDPELGNKILAIGKKHSLSVGKIQEISNITNFSILGFINPNSLIEEIKKTGIEEEKSEEIAEDINKDIFGSIREHLKSLYSNDRTKSGITELTERDLKEQKNREEEHERKADLASKGIAEKRLDGIHSTTESNNNYSEEKVATVLDPYREPIE